MTLCRRVQVPAVEIDQWKADGYREVYRLPGGMRTEGEAVVMEWRAPDSYHSAHFSLASPGEGA